MAGIYIHIPFCKTRCIYCDFYSTTRSKLKGRYIHALCKELQIRKEYLREEPVETIYFGGGTPSQLAEEDFRETLDVVCKVQYDSAFTFIYSKRTGTPAAVMENQVDEEVVKKNFNRVLEVLNPIILEINKEKVGKTYKVLADDVSANDPSFITGRLEDNSLVHFKADKSLIGEIVDVKITDCKTFYLIGERV